ncbi:MAG: DUF4834 family protein [Bacteroidia bacterium]
MRILFIIIMIYLAFRLLVNFVLPLVLRSVVQKAAQNMNQGPFQQQNYQTNKRREGEVSIETPKPPKNKRGSLDDTGEYVDFTEIK